MACPNLAPANGAAPAKPSKPPVVNSGGSILQGGVYNLVHGERGASVAILASEPITASRTDWVVVPKNTAVIISREKSGFLNIMRSQLGPGCPQALQASDGSAACQRSVSTCYRWSVSVIRKPVRTL